MNVVDSPGRSSLDRTSVVWPVWAAPTERQRSRAGALALRRYDNTFPAASTRKLCYPFHGKISDEFIQARPAPRRPLPSQVVKDDEPVLVAAAKAGRFSAFETLVGRYERKIFRLTQNITQNREDAEDAMQEAFLKAYEHLREFRGQFPLLYLACAHRRQPGPDEAPQAPPERRLARRGSRYGRGHDAARRRGLGTLARTSATGRPSLPAFSANVIGELDPPFRIVFQLRDIEELSTEETAEALGLSVPAVKSRLLRARLKLRQKLNQYFRRGENQ